jgi:hypothetical protein
MKKHGVDAAEYRMTLPATELVPADPVPMRRADAPADDRPGRGPLAHVFTPATRFI